PESVMAHVAPAMPLARVPLYPTLGDVPPPQAFPAMPSQAPPPVYAMTRERSSAPIVSAGARVARSRAYDPELVESLALPLGATESVLGVNELPTNPLQAR